MHRGRVSGANTKKQTHSDESAASVAADTRRVMTRRPVDPKESGSGARTVIVRARVSACILYYIIYIMMVLTGARSETTGPY